MVRTHDFVSRSGLLSLLLCILVATAFAGAAGITRELYVTFDKWFRLLPGGLGVATIAACAGFAAVSGSSVAAAAAMGNVALPEMRRFGYAPRLATGVVAAGGTLSFLIPPSLGFVVYGMLTEQSIGKLLISGILPGIAALIVEPGRLTVPALLQKAGYVFESATDWDGAFLEVARRGVWWELGRRWELPASFELVTTPAWSDAVADVCVALAPLYGRID